MPHEFGPESILPYSYAGTIGQLGYGSMDRRFFYRLGASQLDRTICSAAGTAALKSIYGTRLGTAPQDFALAGLIIVWGGNVHGNNVHLWPFIEEARRKGGKLVVIDPYRTRTAALADEHLQIRPGTDGLLALAIMHILFREGLEDRDYLNEFTNDWQQLREHALRPEHSPERAAARSPASASTPSKLSRSPTAVPDATAALPQPSGSTTASSAARTAARRRAPSRCFRSSREAGASTAAAFCSPPALRFRSSSSGCRCPS